MGEFYSDNTNESSGRTMNLETCIIAHILQVFYTALLLQGYLKAIPLQYIL